MIRLDKLTALLLPVAVILMVLALQSAGQSPSQEAPKSATNRNQPDPPPSAPKGIMSPRMDAPRGIQAPADQDFSKLKWELPVDADKTMNPIATSEESIAKGKELYLTRKGNCVFCHGESGAGNEENLPRLRRKPANLSNRERMTEITDGEIFWKVTLGIPGIMPGREKQLTEEERWHVVNYVRTLAVEKTK